MVAAADVADIIDEQSDPSVVVAHQHVHVAVVVDIAEGGPAAYLGQLEHRASPVGDLLEPPVGEIAEQLFSLVQRKRIVRARKRLDSLHRSVDRQEVQPAVVVKVEPGGPETGVRETEGTQSRTRTLFFKDAGSVVDKEITPLTPQFGHEQVFVPIVVEIARVHTHARFRFAVRA